MTLLLLALLSQDVGVIDIIDEVDVRGEDDCDDDLDKGGDTDMNDDSCARS